MSKTFVETSTELLEGLDEMIREGYYASRVAEHFSPAS